MRTSFDRRSLSAQLSDWKAFYKQEFGIRLGDIVLPSERDGFEKLIVVASNLTIERVLAQCNKHYPVFRGVRDSSFDEIVLNSERVPATSYAVTTPDESDAVCGVLPQSAVEFEQAGKIGMTLLESLLFSLKYFKETGKGLQSREGIACMGTRFVSDFVPYICKGCSEIPGDLGISFYEPDYPFSPGYLREVHLAA